MIFAFRLISVLFLLVSSAWGFQHNGTTFVPDTAYVHDGTSFKPASKYLHNGTAFEKIEEPSATDAFATNWDNVTDPTDVTCQGVGGCPDEWGVLVDSAGRMSVNNNALDVALEADTETAYLVLEGVSGNLTEFWIEFDISFSSDTGWQPSNTMYIGRYSYTGSGQSDILQFNINSAGNIASYMFRGYVNGSKSEPICSGDQPFTPVAGTVYTVHYHFKGSTDDVTPDGLIEGEIVGYGNCVMSDITTNPFTTLYRLELGINIAAFGSQINTVTFDNFHVYSTNPLWSGSK